MIEEKRINNDVLWTLKLCHSRVAISLQGSIDLQVMVLEESAETALRVRCSDEALKFTEKALAICVKLRHPRTVTILISLCSLYKKLAMNNKAMLILHEYVRSASNESPTHDVLYQIALCHLRNDDPEVALKYFNDACNATDDEDYPKSLEHLRKSRQLKAHCNVHEQDEHMQFKDRLEEALIEWFCGESIRSLETIQEIANKYFDVSVSMALDDSCLYEVLECESFVGVSSLHAQMMHGDFESATRTMNAIYGDDKRGIICAIDQAIILWHNCKIEVWLSS
ncbi:unnamed protein product [Toxocara canis]|uniref:Uncharacterized protein n=1 Tax=Toxocara canis TaxID=6265 RepID=A0A3P7IUY7_TOXCA|nr:unnamed protein product [Toxocara canis]